MSIAPEVAGVSTFAIVVVTAFVLALRLPPHRAAIGATSWRRVLPSVVRAIRSARERLASWGARSGRPRPRVIALGAAGVVAAAVVGVLPVAATLLGAWVVRRVRGVTHTRRRHDAIARDLPDAIDHLVLTAQAGLGPHQAVRDLARAAPRSLRAAFGATVHELDRGRPFADALEVLRREVGHDADLLVDSLAGAERYGSALAPVFDRLSADARQARRRLDEADARRLPVRLSFPLVLCTLPAFVLLAIAPPVLAALSSLGVGTA